MTVLTIDELHRLFFTLTKGWSWEVQGFLDSNNYVHPIDSDTKVISTVFERMSAPVLRSIANKRGYTVDIANQTTYPDFTLTNKGASHRIALDVKTTYLKPRLGFTLGGYNSFLRKNTKNILYPYDTYTDHWILGFIYRRREPFMEYDLDNLPKKGDVNCPYTVEEVFIREKHHLCGLRAGSGNTKNIGSFIGASPKDFITKSGPFSSFKDGKSASDFYWRNYERYINEIKSEDDLLKHIDFAKYL